MVRKLIKHEILRTGPLLGLILGVGTLTVLGSGVLASLRFPLLSTVSAVIGFIAVAFPWPLGNLALTIDFWRTSWGRAGYLTHSLPAKGSTILWARLAWGLVAQLVFLVWTVSAMLAMLYLANPVPAGDGPGIERIISQALGEISRMVPWWQSALVVLALLLIGWAYLVMFYFAATVGNGPKLAGFGAAGPVITWVITYVVLGFLIAGSFLLPVGLVLGDRGLHFTTVDMVRAVQVNDGSVIPFGFVPVIIASVAIWVPWMAHNWNQRVSLR